MAPCAGCYRKPCAIPAGAPSRKNDRDLRGARRTPLDLRAAPLTHSGTPRPGATASARPALRRGATYSGLTFVMNDAFRRRRRWPSGVVKPLALLNVDEPPPQLGSIPAHRCGQWVMM